jgi:hypothetical protein
MDREQIDDVICEILFRDGPDRHVDGHDIITDFVVALVAGKGDEWARKYATDPNYKIRYIKNYI